jgi:hypothetical protein
MSQRVSPPQTAVARRVPTSPVRAAHRASQELARPQGHSPALPGRWDRRDGYSLPDGTPITVYVERPRIDWSRTSLRIAAVVIPTIAFLAFVCWLIASLVSSIVSLFHAHTPVFVAVALCILVGMVIFRKVGTTVINVVFHIVINVKG